jgi:peptidylprolyl isomerase
MAQAKDGDTIKVHYTGKLDDGSVFDSSADRDPLEFKLGENRIIRGFENAVIGMEPGEKSTAKIPAEEAFGPHRDEMVMEVKKEDLPTDLEPKIGQKFNLHHSDDQTIIVTVTEVTEDTVTLDANHTLAGKDLTFDIELVEIVEA